MSTKVWGNNSRTGLPYVRGIRTYVLQTGTPSLNNKVYFNVFGEPGVDPVPGRWNPQLTPTYRPIAFLSEELAVDISISGSITLRTTNAQPVNGSANLRMRLSRWRKRSDDIQTIVELSAPFEKTASTVTVFTGTPAQPIPMVAGDRFFLEEFADSTAGSFGTGYTATNCWAGFGSTTTVSELSILFTETFTFNPNLTSLHLRRNATHTIGGNFWDALPTLGGSAATTAITATAAGATEKQLTRTSGGTVLEWVTPRFKLPFMLDQWDPLSSPISGTLYLHQSSLSGNAGALFKVWKRSPSGTETLVMVTESTVELTTTSTGYGFSGMSGSYSFPAPVPFYADDRMVIRVYLVPVGGTMAGGFTATLTYDHNFNDVAGDSYIYLYSVPGFKAESDPATPATIPDGTSTMGIGN